MGIAGEHNSNARLGSGTCMSVAEVEPVGLSVDLEEGPCLDRRVEDRLEVEIARIAGIMAAKKTSELIPLCHQINLSKVNVTAEYSDNGIDLEAEAITTAQTGVEMEALTAVTIAALTIYDMCKAVQKDIEITDVRLESKSGGKEDYLAETRV